MPVELSQIPRPQAERFAGKRNLFLVPNYVMGPGTPADGQELITRYWSDVRDSIASLERSLGAVSKVYHELIAAPDEEGLQQVEMINPSACTLIRAMCQSTAALRPLEDAELVAEHTDWQRVLTMGPASQKVLGAALEGYESTLSDRYAAIAEWISNDLAEGETAALFIREDHRVQFPTELQVFYVAPPSLDALKRWLDDFFRGATQPADDTPTVDSEET